MCFQDLRFSISAELTYTEIDSVFVSHQKRRLRKEWIVFICQGWQWRKEHIVPSYNQTIDRTCFSKEIRYDKNTIITEEIICIAMLKHTTQCIYSSHLWSSTCLTKIYCMNGFSYRAIQWTYQMQTRHRVSSNRY